MENDIVFDEKNKVLGGVLYVVGTPIGNLSDISERALKTLEMCSFIAAEDTRVTSKLLSRYGLKKKIISYHEHNKAKAGAWIVSQLKNGESCAIVTDAGTPAISDPGADLVLECIRENIDVTSVPGACAAINALVLSGLNTRRFCFEGFLPEKLKDREERMTELSIENRTMIFYSSPYDVVNYLTEFSKYFGDRQIALCREMTKLNEEVIRTTINGALNMYLNDDSPRGEYVIIVSGRDRYSGLFWENMTVDEHVRFYMDNGLKKMDAIKKVASDRAVPKNEIYKEFI